MPETTDLSQIQRQIIESHRRITRIERAQREVDETFLDRMESAKTHDGRAADYTEQAEAHRRAGRVGAAKTAEYAAKRQRGAAAKDRRNGTLDRDRESDKLGRKRTGWARTLAKLLAAAAAVAIGATVMTPDVSGRESPDMPGRDEVVVVPDPPRLDDDPEAAAVDAEQPDTDTTDDRSSGDDPDGDADDETADRDASESAGSGAEVSAGDAEKDPAGESAAPTDVSSVLIHAYYIGGGNGMAPGHRGGVPFVIETLDDSGETTQTRRGTTTDSSDGTLQPLPAGSYRLTIDASQFNTIVCDGRYSKPFEVEKGQKAVATAYLVDQGSNSHVPADCLKIDVSPAE